MSAQMLAEITWYQDESVNMFSDGGYLRCTILYISSYKLLLCLIGHYYQDFLKRIFGCIFYKAGIDKGIPVTFFFF